MGSGSWKKRGGLPPADVSLTAGVAPIPAETVGHRLLQKMGWSGGGLGSDGRGMADPVDIVMRAKGAGLGLGTAACTAGRGPVQAGATSQLQQPEHAQLQGARQLQQGGGGGGGRQRSGAEAVAMAAAALKPPPPNPNDLWNRRGPGGDR